MLWDRRETSIRACLWKIAEPQNRSERYRKVLKTLWTNRTIAGSRRNKSQKLRPVYSTVVVLTHYYWTDLDLYYYCTHTAAASLWTHLHWCCCTQRSNTCCSAYCIFKARGHQDLGAPGPSRLGAARTVWACGGTAAGSEGHGMGILQKIRELSNHIRICSAIFRIFIKFGIMGWIWIDFALLNTLYKCQIHRFFYPLVRNGFLIRTTIFT